MVKNSNLSSSKIVFPKIMGVVNVTPDSFTDGGKYLTFDNAFQQSMKLIEEGADFIDIGGESTRPGAEEVSLEDELNRVVPVISAIRKANNEIRISVDTTKYEVALESIKAGADIINDISGLTFEPRLADLAAEYNKGLILMHIQGKPRTMQHNPQYKDVVSEVYEFLNEKYNFAKSKGIKEIYVDVGIGFGKTLDHNLDLIKNIDKFKEIAPVLLGISRKSMFKMMLGIENVEERDLPTILVHTLQLNKNVDIIRVHNVKQATIMKKIYERIS